MRVAHSAAEALGRADAGAGAAAAGEQTKMRRRLGDSTALPAVYGPLISTLRSAAPMRVSGTLFPAGYGRRNGSRGVSSIAELFFKNATTTSWSPAVTGTRTTH